MAVGIAGAGETVADNWRPLPSIAVMVVNEAAAPSIVVARAEMEAASIYRRLGVNLVWVKSTNDDREYPVVPRNVY